ncbi:hypothetical protein SAMN05518855_102428 [Paenibacillus sp. CF384]|nr:hypothetical protein SAMN05518855_102428 [Paenibacillus sp. CF384]
MRRCLFFDAFLRHEGAVNALICSISNKYTRPPQKLFSCSHVIPTGSDGGSPSAGLAEGTFFVETVGDGKAHKDVDPLIALGCRNPDRGSPTARENVGKNFCMTTLSDKHF